MLKKRIFKKKSINVNKYLVIFLFIFSLIVILILLFTNLKQQFFIVPEFVGSFYIIPDDKEGKEVMNKDKKSLHLNDEKILDVEIINDPSLEYSIQIFSSSDYYLVKEKFDFITNKSNNYFNDLPLKINDFFIVFFNTDMGNEHILLYKNFSTRILASDYCLKHLNFLQKCLIVNAQNLN